MRAGWLAIALAMVVTTAAGAQRVEGRVLDHETRIPVSGGTIVLIDADGGHVGFATSAGDGRFRVDAPGAGEYRILVRRVGYRPLRDGPFGLEAGTVREVQYLLELVPVRLDPLAVQADRDRRERHLREVGFYERQKADFGHFMARDEIAERRARRFTDLLTMIPGVSLAIGSTGAVNGVQLRGSRLSEGGRCHPRVYVDGQMVIRGGGERRLGLSPERRPEDLATERAAAQTERDEVALDDVVMPDDVEAIEVFRSSVEVPVRFGGMSVATQCGVIVVWTRHGGREGT